MQPPAPPPDRPALPRTLDELPPLRRETFEARLDRWLPDLEAALRPLYVDRGPSRGDSSSWGPGPSRRAPTTCTGWT